MAKWSVVLTADQEVPGFETCAGSRKNCADTHGKTGYSCARHEGSMDAASEVSPIGHLVERLTPFPSPFSAASATNTGYISGKVVVRHKRKGLSCIACASTPNLLAVLTTLPTIAHS